MRFPGFSDCDTISRHTPNFSIIKYAAYYAHDAVGFVLPGVNNGLVVQPGFAGGILVDVVLVLFRVVDVVHDEASFRRRRVRVEGAHPDHPDLASRAVLGRFCK